MRARTVLAAIAAFGMVVGLAACGSDHVSAPSRAVGTKLDGPIPSSILDIPLVDSTGRTRHISDFKGKVVVISDVMTLCQETCPLDTASVVQTARNADHAGATKKVEFLSITVDPQRDTVPQLAAYRKLYHAPRNWLTLTGDPADVQRLWTYFGVWTHKVPTTDKPAPRNWRTGKPLTYDVQHSDEVFFLDGRGHERFVLEGMPDVGKRSEVPRRLYRFLSGDGRKNLAHPQPTDWTEPQALHVLSWLLDERLAAHA